MEAKALALLDQKGDGERHAVLRAEMGASMEKGCGIYRLGPEMQDTCDKLAELRRRYAGITLEDKSRAWNTDWITAIELGFQLDVAEAMAHSGWRGPNPAVLTSVWTASSSATTPISCVTAWHIIRAPPLPTSATAPVTITKSPPGQRAYGALGEHEEAHARQGRASASPQGWGAMSDTMDRSKTIELRVLRYRPASDGEPVFVSYRVPYSDDMSVLQALQSIKDTQDGSLSFRWSCRMAVCGSCGMMINGEPKLACNTFVRDLAPDAAVIEPLQNFPIERDLVVTRGRLRQEDREHLSLHHPEGAEADRGRHYLQTPAQMAAYESFSDCINCMLCYAACPQFGANPDFIGPGAMAMLQRYNGDSRDGGRQFRLDQIRGEDGVGPAPRSAICSEVCPKQVDPANAVNQNKTKSALDFFLHYVRPGGEP